MNDALGVAGSQRIRHLDADVEDVLQLHRPAHHALFQADALQPLHHDEGVPVGVFNVMDGADSRMVQLRGGACLPEEAVERLAVVDQLGRDKLQCDVAAQARVFRVVDSSHAPATEFRNNSVMGDGLANQTGGERPLAVMLGRARLRVN